MSNCTKVQVQRAADAIETMFPGSGARLFNWDDGTGWKIALNCGDSFTVADTLNRTEQVIGVKALPKGTYLEPINAEALGLYRA